VIGNLLVDSTSWRCSHGYF